MILRSGSLLTPLYDIYLCCARSQSFLSSVMLRMQSRSFLDLLLTLWKERGDWSGHGPACFGLDHSPHCLLLRDMEMVRKGKKQLISECQIMRIKIVYKKGVCMTTSSEDKIFPPQCITLYICLKEPVIYFTHFTVVYPFFKLHSKRSFLKEKMNGAIHMLTLYLIYILCAWPGRKIYCCCFELKRSTFSFSLSALSLLLFQL